MPPDPAPQFIDLNILPAQYRPRPVSRTTTLMGAIALALLVLLVPGAVVLRNTQSQVRRMETVLPRAQATLRAMRTPNPEQIALTQELSQTLRLIETVRDTFPEIEAGGQDWSTLLGAILMYDRNTISLSSLSPEQDALRLSGLGRSQDDVLAYANQLDASGVFERVLVQSMENTGQLFAPEELGPLPPTGSPGAPTLTPTSAPTAAGTLTPTPLVLYDAFEPDDSVPRPITAGAVQRHNINPDNDVDQVVFRALAGRRYCIQAMPEATGLDMYIEVLMGGALYGNDNCLPTALQVCQCPSGSTQAALAAVVELTVPAGADQEVIVRVMGRGAAGPEAWYMLSITEAVGGGVGATGDAYEPDDLAARPIRPGEAQQRTFYPQGDVDRVEFDTRVGYVYTVATSGLTPGVDTTLAVLVDGAVYANDNVAPGDLSSRVTFTALQNGKATVTVANQGAYGPSMAYTLTLTEAAVTATPMPTWTSVVAPSPTPTVECGDSYEPDDSVPRPIAAGVPQVRNFCPQGDVDRAVFSAKAGYAYRIETLDLAPGVDTVLAVIIGTQTLVNDDRAPSDPRSLVEVRNLQSGDMPVYVQVSNKGIYGPNQIYRLMVTETGATDPYEPDDINAVEIYVGSPQARTFFPAGDVDKVFFLAQPAYSYRISTSGLSAGVDTVLTVNIGARTLIHDNRSGSDLSSVVEFNNDTGGVARVVATITNKGQFGPSHGYTVQVELLGQGDPYEPDDTAGVPIAPGAVQQRTFYPSSDVDRVYFTAQPYHQYRIQTQNLATGVDTALAVSMGSTTLTNDDRTVGNPSSLVEITNNTAGSQVVSVLITNKGAYGPDKRYEIRVDDLGTGPGDAYEPDDTIKRYIAVGEVQQRTFNPAGDIDRAFLIVKAGRRYSVMTCGTSATPGTPPSSTDPFDPLALACYPHVAGVDPLLTITGPVRGCVPPGCMSDNALSDPAYKNARVEFEAVSDGEAVIMLYNRGSFSPAAVYYLRAYEIAMRAPTVTPTVTAAPSTPTLTPTSGAYPTAYPTATATPPASATPAVVATATATTDPYPPVMLRDEMGSGALAAPVSLRDWWAPTPAPALALQARVEPTPTLANGAIRFVLLLRLKGPNP